MAYDAVRIFGFDQGAFAGVGNPFPIATPKVWTGTGW